MRELSLRHLGVERIDLYQLHRIDPQVPLEDQLGELEMLQEEGKIRHIGLSEVTVAQIEQARRDRPDRRPCRTSTTSPTAAPRTCCDYCEERRHRVHPVVPDGDRRAGQTGGPLRWPPSRPARRPAQLALAWLLRRSPVMLPIPGTSKVAHVEENIAAAEITLTDEEYRDLETAV